MTFNLVFKLLGSLSLLIFGMKLMSESLQKLTGSSLRHTLANVNFPFLGQPSIRLQI